MKRVSILVGLFILFLSVFIVLAGCGLSTESATDNLGNAIASGDNGPGSGNWNPTHSEF